MSSLGYFVCFLVFLEVSAGPRNGLVDERGFRQLNVGVLLVSGTGSGFDLEKASPAVDLALEIVNDRYLKPHRVVLRKIQRSYPTCDNTLTPGLAADMKFLSNVVAFIGPACGFALEPVARLAAYWNIPIVTGLGDQPPSTESEVTGDKLLGGLKKIQINDTQGVFGDKSKFMTLTRLSYCQCRLKLVFDAICNAFSWKHLIVIYDRTDLFSFTVGRVLISGMKELDYEVYGHDLDGTVLSDMDHALEEILGHGRIVILSLQESLVREFMLKAHYKGMTSGEWAFLDVELFKNKPSETNYWQKGDINDLDAKEAYEALITISLLIPKSAGWDTFSNHVKERAQRDYNYTFPEEEQVNFFIGAFYDGVILLGKALNETLTEKGSLDDGKGIALRMWNRTFQGVTGSVTIDENGDRNADYSILDMNPDSGHFEVVASYLSQRGFVRMPERQVRWPQNRGPPPDVPECGFLNNDAECLERRESRSVLPFVAAFALVFSLLIAAIVVYVYKHMREVELASSTRWRIMAEDLLMDAGEPKSLCEESQVYSSVNPIPIYIQKIAGEEKDSSRGSLSLGTGAAGPQATFVPTAYHKGVQVALKKITLVKRTEFTKKILSEIRQVKEVQHENVCRVIGLCLSSSDPKSTSEKWDQIVLVSEYCSRGSLRDVLLNAHIHLDWPFRLSLISDVVAGMSFLHSNIGPHGRLSSAKCLVDARFVVKIADFGVHTLLGYQKPAAMDSDYYFKLFWVAPEHLTKTIGSVESSLKGDIYSFAIILHEVATRCLPFSAALANSLSPEDIVNKVRMRTAIPFRPEVPEDVSCLEIRHLIQQCWADNPDDRPPDFPSIKQLLRRLMKGAGTVGLVDDLLRRLEQHASHLETLVEDKTRELNQEKRRSEDLLYQVLPRQVAEQLLRGETVVPESFDAVTIYFSDVVSFTSICAKSTPMQVVDFLNNLYGTFDGILDSFDAYKVETIGDAYMVVSGAPKRNDDLHVTEIAYLALAVLDAVTNYEIGHLPQEQLKIRIGIHTGPVCAGVVGHRMPHYCLFGDTVNTASRMESSGLPLKIHVSRTTANALSETGGFHLTPRGEVVLKGKGSASTFWLEGCDDEFQWKRIRQIHTSGSKDSVGTRASVNVLSHSVSPALGNPLLNLSTSQSQSPSSGHQHYFSGSNNVTTIYVTPAE